MVTRLRTVATFALLSAALALCVGWVLPHRRLHFRATGGGGEWPETDIVAWWPIDEGTGSTIADAAGSNDGTLSGATPPTWTTISGYSTALDFDGSTSYVACGSNGTVMKNGPWTIAALIYADDLTGYHTIASNWVPLTGAPGWLLATNGQTLRMFLADNDGANVRLVETGNVLTASTAHFVVLTHDGTDNASGMQFYVDGDSVSTSVVSNSNPGTMASGAVWIGIRNSSTDKFPWNGKIASVAIWDAELSAATIESMYNSLQ